MYLLWGCWRENPPAVAGTWWQKAASPGCRLHPCPWRAAGSSKALLWGPIHWSSGTYKPGTHCSRSCPRLPLYLLRWRETGVFRMGLLAKLRPVIQSRVKGHVLDWQELSDFQSVNSQNPVSSVFISCLMFSSWEPLSACHHPAKEPGISLRQ